MVEVNHSEFSTWSGWCADVMSQRRDSEQLMIQLSTATEDREPHTVSLSTWKTWWISCRFSCYEILCSPADIASKNAGMQDIGSKRVFVKKIIIRIMKNKEAELKAVFLQVTHQLPMRETETHSRTVLIRSEADFSLIAATLRGRRCSQPVQII